MDIGRKNGYGPVTVEAGQQVTPAVDVRTSAALYIRSTQGGAVGFIGFGSEGKQQSDPGSALNDETGTALGMTLVADQWCFVPEKVSAFAGFLQVNFGVDASGAVVEFALKG